MGWVEAGVFADGMNGTSCRVLVEQSQLDKGYPNEKTDIFNNVVEGFQIAQRILKKVDGLQQSVRTWNSSLPDDDWNRLQWAAWKTLGCHVTRAKSIDETPLFSREQWLLLLAAHYKVKGGLLGGGAVTVKVGFPGIVGCVCRAFMGVQGMYLGGLVKPHLQIGRAPDQPKGKYFGIPVVMGEIHIAVKEASSRWHADSQSIAVVLMHEAFHRYASLSDFFYLDDDFEGRGAKVGRECFNNADSHAKFWSLIAGEMPQSSDANPAWKPWIASPEYRKLNMAH